MNKERDEKFMRAALNEAKKTLGQTSPNPAVGAVLVVGNRIVAKGHHRGAGHDHAEVECLRDFSAPLPARATLYVTLEPCSTTGRTAPCTDAIIRAGLENVVIGATDLNPRHSGRGMVELQNAGIRVRAGILAEECTQLNEAFNKWIVTGKPFVIAKCGMSLDGRLTRPVGESHWITGNSARRHAHQLRAGVDAILVGAETVRADNPRLTVRGVRHAQQPWRVVLTRSRKLPRHAHLFSDQFSSRTLVYRRKSLAAVLKTLGKQDITSVLIEGGGDVLSQALDAHLIDKVQLYLGPILTGGPVIAFPGKGTESTANALRLRRVSYRQIGQSVCITGYPEILRPENPENFLSSTLFNLLRRKNMKKLLLIALVAGGLTFVAAPRSDAQVSFSIGVGPGYYGYYPYGYYYPYRYYRPYPYYGYYRPYWYGGHRYYRHHRYHHYYRY